MNDILKHAIRPVPGNDINRIANTVKQGLQEIILMALSDSGFFEQAVFHGGTCLRILHGLDRFSEDLDFTLRERNLDFDLTPDVDVIETDLKNMGLTADISLRKPRDEMMVYSAKIKLNFRDVLIRSGFSDGVVRVSHSKANIVVKIDVDLDPPVYSKEIIVEKKEPLEYDVRTEPLSVLFAGKTAAVLCRHWGNRVKGRDFYDFRWYVERGVPLDLGCLESRLDKKCTHTEKLDRDTLVCLLKDRFDTLDWDSARDDVMNFIEPSQLGEWNGESFKDLADRLDVLEE